ncbi:MAG: acetolactate synthase small subunit [Candidatus Sumerlaeia bacterium]|nr:acetolactate synthase small subunit [Candidatus Sumerlaeia bacterium]
MQHIISVLVENKFGVLAHIAGLFSSRGFNIDSLTVGETQDPTVSRMTIVVTGDDRTLEQVEKQLNKLIDVIKVQDLTQEKHVERELILIKINCTPQTRAEIIQIANIFNARIVDFTRRSIVVELVGSQDKIAAFIDLVKVFGIRELTRTGRIAIQRGD